MDSKTSVLVFLVVCCAWQVQSLSFNCSSAGRFPDSSDKTCQSYILCVYDRSTGTYFPNYYRCPSTSVFNPDTKRCTASSNYVCNSTMSGNSTAASNSTTSNNTKPVKSVCTSEGYIPDPSVTDCSRFIECITAGSAYLETTRTCPDGTYFNPLTFGCEYYYHCPFTCHAPGRFANSADPTCKTYYFCVLKPDRSFWQLDYVCTFPAIFNPTSKICSSRYVCPKQIKKEE